MSYTFTPPSDTGDLHTTQQTISLSLPAGTPLAIPTDPDRWEQRNGCITATYTWEELRLVVGLALEQKRMALEARLERGLAVMAEATGCPDAEAGRLLAHWDALDLEYGAVLERIAEVMGDG